MTDPNKAVIAALLDRSGPMETSKQATEDGCSIDADGSAWC